MWQFFLSGGVLEQEVVAAGGAIHDMEKLEGFDTNLASRLRKLIRQHHIDVVHTNNYSPWIYAGLAMIGNRARLIHTEHSIAPGNLRRRFLAERMLSWLTEAIVAVSEDVKTKLVRFTGMRISKVHVVCNGVDTDVFRPDTHVRSRARQEWGISEEAVVFGTVGRLVPVKDQATLLHAFALLCRREPRAVLVIIGDGELRETLRALARELEIDARVHFMGQRQDIHRLLPGMDVFMLSSESEGLSVSLLEALACSLPAIATRAGGNPELIHDGVNGQLVAVGNRVEMAEAMHSLSQDPELRQRMGRQARAGCMERYSFAAMIHAYERLYEQNQVRS